MTNQTTKRVFVTGALCGALALAMGTAQARQEPQAQPMGQGQGERMASAGELTHTSATIAAIDKSTRMVTLKKQDGDKFSVKAPADMQGFDKLKVGDRVDVDYYESVGVSVLPPGTKPSMSEKTAVERGGVKGGAGAERVTTISAKVVSVDASANKVTLQGPRGETKTVTVQNPQVQQRLPNLKPGDVVQVTLTEAVAASIQPSGSK